MSRSAMAWLVGLMLGAACNGRAEEAAAPSRPDVVPSCPRTSGVNPEEARTMSPSTNPTGGARWLERLKTENPETFERLMQLRDTDPAKFHSELRRLLLRRGAPKPADPKVAADEAACRDLAQRYHAATAETEKTRLKAELRALVENMFAARTKADRERLARVEQEVDRLRARLAERETKRDEVCAARVEELLTPPAAPKVAPAP